MLDRIDLHVEVTPVVFDTLNDNKKEESSEAIQRRVEGARELQRLRYVETPQMHTNSQMTSRNLRTYCKLDEQGAKLLKRAMDKLGLSARAYDRILKVSRTIADLDRSDKIKVKHLAEAIQYRSLDRDFWTQGA